LTDDKLQALAYSLGLSGRSLQSLRVGWDGHAFTFPMFDDCGKIIGIRRRFPNGSKISVKGGRNGLFIPTDLTEAGPLLVCEGPTDTAAALGLGFAAIGRPNCNSLVEMTVRAVRGRDEIVVVADNDAVGQMGADRLAGVLALCCPHVRIVHPPDGVKDLRQWLNAGLTCEILRKVIGHTCPMRMTVSFSLAQAGRGGRR
jgi:DNA primase